MSLGKLLRSSIRLFKKDAISFLIVRRYDLGQSDEKLSYLSVSPHSSTSMLRYKIWHLLDLPDFCDEVILLKSSEGMQIPLTSLNKGNSPEQPFILEVWPPHHKTNNKLQRAEQSLVTNSTKMLTECKNECDLTKTAIMDIPGDETLTEIDDDTTTVSGDKRIYTSTLKSEFKNAENKKNYNNMLSKDSRFTDKRALNFFQTERKKSDLTFKISTSSLFFKSHSKKDDTVNILLKIQNDLNLLSSKLSNLEDRVNN